MTIIQNNAKVVATCNQRITALKKLVGPKGEVKIGSEHLKLSELIALYQECIDTRSELTSKRAAYRQALVARDGAEATRLATDKGLKTWAAYQFGLDGTEAEELGFAAPKVAEKSAETKALAVAKLRATREARMTMGKRQKKRIKGAVVAPAEPAVPAIAVQAAPPAASPVASANGAPNGASLANGVTATH